MNRLLKSTLVLLVLPLAAQAEMNADDLWRRGSPESQGFSTAKLEALREGLAARSTKALLVIRNDTIVCEWYAPGQDAQTRFGTASLAKALVGGVSFAVAMSDGRIGLDDPAARFIPQWRDDPRKSRITLRQLGSHTSGVEDAEADNKPHDQLDGWKGDFWKHLPVPNDPFSISRDRAPLVFEPGTEMRYSNPGIALLTYCVTASLGDAPQKDIRSLLRDRVLRPIGIPDAEWSAGYGKTSVVDGLPLVGSWGGAAFTARAAARVGRLMLRGGDWDGKRILSTEAVQLTTSDAGTPGPCGIGWWSNNEGDCAKLPRDAFFGSGAGHQILLVIPSLKLIVVRFGATLAETAHDPKAFHETYRLYLFEPLMEAITDKQVKSVEGRSAGATHTVADLTGKAIQAAIDACAEQGGGVAYVPPGRYFTGPLWLKDNVELRLEAGATVVLSTEKKDWPTGVRALINAKGVKRIAITGRGSFDGNAQWEYAPVRGQDPEISEEQEIARRAGVEMKRYYRKGEVQKYLFVLQDAEDLRLEGVTIQNAPLWNVRLQNCSRVWIRGIRLYSDLEKGVNSDGIDIVSSSDVLIADSIISTADDAICLKTTDLGERGRGTIRPTENVVVNNCILISSSTAMMIGTETHADIRHVLFSNIIVRNSNKVFGINVQDGATVSDVHFANITFETNRRHWNWWGSAEVMKFVLKKRTADSRLGRIRDITIDGAQGTARGTSLVAGQAERRLENITVANLRVKMLPENQPDKRATHALVFQGIDGLTVRGVEVDWDREAPEPKWGSALVLRDISNLALIDFHGHAAQPEGRLPAILKQNVTDRHVP